MDNTIDDVPEQIIEQVRQFLGQDGYQFFKEIYDQYGQLNVAWNEGGIPHCVHFIEGMQIRNFLRSQTEVLKYADDHTLDDLWEPIVLAAINV